MTLKASAHPALIADRAKMFIDAEHDQDKFRDDTAEHDADNQAGNGRQQARGALDADRQPIDLLKAARAVGKEPLAAGGGAG